MPVISKWVTFFSPMILVTYPVTFYYAENTREAIWFYEVVATLSVFLSATLILLLSWNLLTKDATKSSIATSVLIVAFFAYKPAQSFLSSIEIVTLGQDRLLLPATAVVSLACIVFVLRSRISWRLVLQGATFVVLFLVVFNLGRVGIDTLNAPHEQTIYSRASSLNLDYATARNGLPDIYYIVLDAYGRGDVLKEIYNYDNADFLEFLTQNGFIIASESRSNYVNTEQALAASLNMRYLSAEENPGWAVKENVVLGIAKNFGYEYLHLSSGWAITKRSKYADVEIVRDRPIQLLLNDFFIGLLRNTIALPFARSIGTNLEAPFAANFGERFNNNMLALRKIPEISGPTFTFSHNIPPHPPYIFDRNGNVPKNSAIEYQGTAWENQVGYIEQLRYVNRVVEQTIAAVLEQSPVEPIIIIHGDHGPASPPGNLDNPTKRFIYQRTGILNAYYLPEYCRSSLYPTISPVNTFRLVFDSCLGTDLGLLEDKTYWEPGGSPIDFSLISP